MYPVLEGSRCGQGREEESKQARSRDRAIFVAVCEQTQPPHPVCYSPLHILSLILDCSGAGLDDLVSPMTFSFSQMGNRLELLLLLLLPNTTNSFLYPLNPSSVRNTGPKVNHNQRPSPYVRMNQELEAAEGTHIIQPISPDGCRRQFLACTVLSRVRQKINGSGC